MEKEVQEFWEEPEENRFISLLQDKTGIKTAKLLIKIFICISILLLIIGIIGIANAKEDSVLAGIAFIVASFIIFALVAFLKCMVTITKAALLYLKEGK